MLLSDKKHLPFKVNFYEKKRFCEKKIAKSVKLFYANAILLSITCHLVSGLKSFTKNFPTKRDID